MLDIGETVEDFVRDYFGFNHDFLGVVAIVNVAFVIVFAFTFAMSIKVFNFQRRQMSNFEISWKKMRKEEWEINSVTKCVFGKN